MWGLGRPLTVCIEWAEPDEDRDPGDERLPDEEAAATAAAGGGTPRSGRAAGSAPGVSRGCRGCCRRGRQVSRQVRRGPPHPVIGLMVRLCLPVGCRGVVGSRSLTTPSPLRCDAVVNDLDTWVGGQAEQKMM